MELQKVKLIYRHVIDAETLSEPERTIWQVTYNEFILRCQAYNPDNQFVLFSEMVAANGKANALHYKISFPVTPFLNQYKNVIPSVTGTLGEPIPFEFSETKLLESAVNDPQKHLIALIFTTPAYHLIRSFADMLLLSPVIVDPHHMSNASPFVMVRLNEGMGMDWIDAATHPNSTSS